MVSEDQEEQQNENEEIKESLQLIDEKLKTLEDFNNRNYKVNEKVVEMWSDMYEEMD